MANKMGRILSLSKGLDIFEDELFVHVPNSGLKSRQCRPQRSKHSHFTTFSRFLARSREYGMASLSIETPQQLVNGGGRAPGTALPSSSRDDHPDLLKGCQPSAAPLRVAVLLSGGVDSSLALQLLLNAGHAVKAYYLQIWFQEDFRNYWSECPWEEDLLYCQAVCDKLNVPLEVVPLTEQYWDKVVTHCIEEVQAGRTPNPDVWCNSRVKFGAFMEYLETQATGKWDYIASGHYARIEHNEQGFSRLALTPDSIKDQTYFLAHLTQHQLSKVLFPLGWLTKAQVRSLAAAASLPNQDRKDSQGICFLGKVKFGEFIETHLGSWPGPLIEEETDQVVGYHRGFWFHTIGQRKGIQLSGGPWYVSRKDPAMNAVYVSRQSSHQWMDDQPCLESLHSSFYCEKMHWTSSVRPSELHPLYCKVRHGPNMYRCQRVAFGTGDDAMITIDGIDQGLAPGQYAVFYQEGYCLGCGVISDEGGVRRRFKESSVIHYA